MKNLRKKLLFAYYLPLLLLIIISVIYAFITHLSVTGEEKIIFCIFKERFHLYCPGCGGSRSLLALLTFDPVRSFIYFPALPITVLITMNLGVMNLLPLPALDGGRMIMILYEMITRKKIPANIESTINAVGLAVLLGLSVIIMIKDVIGLFN